jgi:thiol-disulfide isomerase/thioredoxin
LWSGSWSEASAPTGASQPLTKADLRGKVVLVDIWTYTCINWLRTVPQVRAWAEKYKEQVLVVIGVHTPPSRKLPVPSHRAGYPLPLAR